MSRLPFEKFIMTLLFCNQDVASISKRLGTFGYKVSDADIIAVYDGMKQKLPPSIKELMLARSPLDPVNPEHIQWLSAFGVFEFYDYIFRKAAKLEGGVPRYFKWCEDCLWVHQYKDAMVLVNIFLFNNEPIDSISDVLMYKFKKKIGVDTIELYKKTFWDTEEMTAKDAYERCVPFRDNAVIVRQLRSGETEIEASADSKLSSSDMDNGSDVPFTFHDNEYIKWKIGYRKLKVPDPKTFMEEVKRDSYFKYYESMNMAQNIEYEEEDSNGSNEKIGTFEGSIRRTRWRNVEEQKAKLARSWLDLYMKADKAAPDGSGDSAKDFLDMMSKVALSFKDDEKIVHASDVPGLFEDVKGDMV